MKIVKPLGRVRETIIRNHTFSYFFAQNRMNKGLLRFAYLTGFSAILVQIWLVFHTQTYVLAKLARLLGKLASFCKLPAPFL